MWTVKITNGICFLFHGKLFSRFRFFVQNELLVVFTKTIYVFILFCWCVFCPYNKFSGVWTQSMIFFLFNSLSWLTVLVCSRCILTLSIALKRWAYKIILWHIQYTWFNLLDIECWAKIYSVERFKNRQTIYAYASYVQVYEMYIKWYIVSV